MPLPSLTKQCKATAKHSKTRCLNPAAYGMPVCRCAASTALAALRPSGVARTTPTITTAGRPWKPRPTAAAGWPSYGSLRGLWACWEFWPGLDGGGESRGRGKFDRPMGRSFPLGCVPWRDQMSLRGQFSCGVLRNTVNQFIHLQETAGRQARPTAS